MDKNAIKKYATWARRELISRVSQKAEFYGVTAKGYGDIDADSVDGRVLSLTEKTQRQALIHKVRSEGYEQAMEEVAYTWFNRFSALRYMEVNNYLPTRVRIFTNENGEFKPQIIDEAIHLELDGLDMEKVYSLKDANDTEALYRYLLITQCNALSKIMPVMFQKIDDYTELLLPDYLLREGSVIEQMVTSIPEEDWTDQVQIIGWLYQYYNAEKKDEVFAALKKNVKITKENIPAATQLFTPDWIVRYMVENSLGRLWVEGHPNEQLKSGWKYYLEEAEQEADVEAQLAEIRKEYAALKPEEILCIDPCAGSGHILDYLFDILMQIYTDYSYTTSEAVRSIIENNLYGLDIDERAVQLAYFSVMMKARSYDRRFLTRKDEDGNPDIPQPHVYAIVESNHLNQLDIEYFTNNDPKLKKDFGVLVDELHDAKEYGSILNVSQVDFAALYERIDEIRSDIGMYKESTLKTILPLIQVAETLAQKYHVVVTNPPYMGNFTDNIMERALATYPESKYDLYSLIFTTFARNNLIYNGFISFVTADSWMFTASFEDYRENIIKLNTIKSLLHLGTKAFDAGFGTVAYVVTGYQCSGYEGIYIDLSQTDGTQEANDLIIMNENDRRKFYLPQNLFMELDDKRIAYRLPRSSFQLFGKNTIGDVAEAKAGVVSGKDGFFVRYWYEISQDAVSYFAPESGQEYAKYHLFKNGGGNNQYYGNNYYVIRLNALYDKKYYNKSIRRGDPEYYFKKCITWSKVGNQYRRFTTCENSVCGTASPAIYFQDTTEEFYNYVLAFLNSKIAKRLIDAVNPTMNLQATDVSELPFVTSQEIVQMVNDMSEKNISIAKSDWDFDETSWDFQRHPLALAVQDRQEQDNSQFRSSRMEKFGRISWHYDNWANECAERFTQLKSNEEELNRIFIDIYGLQDELTSEVEDKDVTVRLADKARDIRSFISYAVGCMFGRYSLDVDGLAYAGGEWDASRYSTYIPDKDGIIPICDDEYFEDDIANRFVDFVRVVYGKDTLEENLKFIADALGDKGAPRQVIRDYFMNDFYADHLKVYQKRPIYWLFDSGKKNGFKCLIYIHRYKPDTIARIRTDYVFEQQSRYRTAIAGLENQIVNAGTGERVKLNKQLKKLQNQADELHGYEEKIHHLADQFISIDLDDGVKHNYEIFKDVLAKIK